MNEKVSVVFNHNCFRKMKDFSTLGSFQAVTYTVKMVVHCESNKQDAKLLPITSPNINRFSKSFADRLGGKFATSTTP